MLHYAGDIEAHELGESAKSYLQLYARADDQTVYIPYQDLVKKRKRFIKFEKLNDQWVFVDLVDK
jgi:hypothetical protein